MKTKLLLPLAILALATPLVAGAADVTVLLKVNAGTYLAPGALCPVLVPAGANGVALLDAAVEQGCLLSWSGTTYDFGTFVDCVDGVCATTLPDSLDGTYWETSANLHTLPCSIECYHAADLDVFGLTYQDWYASFVDYLASSALP